jgi:predicted transcriptional regulator
MHINIKTAAYLLLLITLAGCNRLSSYWPLSSGSDQAQASMPAPVMPTDTTPSSPVPPVSVASTAPAPTSNTFVGQKIGQLRNDLSRLECQVSSHGQTLDNIRRETVGTSEKYFQVTASINARLQAGSTPGNPIMTAQFAQAQADLDQINDQVARLNTLSGQIGGDATLASFLLDSAQGALTLSGALEEDHRALKQVQDDVSRTQVAIQRLLNQVTDEVNRQTAYVASERRNLNVLSVAIKNGALFGVSLANTTAPIPAAATIPATIAPASQATLRGTPLVTIHFDRPNPSYQQELYSAVSTALDRRPNASFELVAIAPAQGSAGQVALTTSAAQRNAEAVLRSLAEMGLPANRVKLSATTSRDVDIPQVELFVR